MTVRQVELLPSQKRSKRVGVKAGFIAILDGYTFQNDKSKELTSTGQVSHYWHCEIKTCGARIITDDQDTTLSLPNHNHEPPERKVCVEFWVWIKLMFRLLSSVYTPRFVRRLRPRLKILPELSTFYLLIILKLWPLLQSLASRIWHDELVTRTIQSYHSQKIQLTLKYLSVCTIMLVVSY